MAKKQSLCLSSSSYLIGVRYLIAVETDGVIRDINKLWTYVNTLDKILVAVLRI